MNGNAGKPTDCTVKLNPDKFKRLQDYATIMGTSVNAAVDEALDDFIECCVSTRLESYQRKIHAA